MTYLNKNIVNNKETAQMNLLSKSIRLFAILAVVSVLGSTPVFSQTLEQAKETQVKKALATEDGKIIKEKVDTYSKRYGVDPVLVHAVIMTESGYDKNAKSRCGATGLMQLMPTTFKARQVGSDIYSIDENIHAGIKHLAGLNARYNGNMYKALAAYNLGGGAFDRYNGEMPSHAKKYVDRVYYHKKIVESCL